MIFCARLVVILFLFSVPLVSFEIPPFPPAAAQAAPQAGSAAVPTGEWVARQIEDRDTGRDTRTAMTMKLFDRQERVRERSLMLLALNATAPGQDGIADRVLIRFTYPNDINGTSFLVWERPDGDDERFLFLPALGRVRRIAGSERQESFVGTDFTYEDMGGRAIEDYTYALPDANATWTAPDKSTHAVYILESRTKDAHAKYPRIVSYVRKDALVVVYAEMFNRRNEREKTYRVNRLDRVQGFWTALDAVMTNELARTRTELTVTKAEYNVGLKDADVSRRELERGAR